jgi:hypothetical protein
VRKTALVLLGALVLPAFVSSSPAEARYWRGGWGGGYWGGGFGPAIAAPLIAGAVIGGLATSAYAYGPGYYGVAGPYGYYPGPYGYYPANAYQTYPNCTYGETYRCNYPAYGGRYGYW